MPNFMHTAVSTWWHKRVEGAPPATRFVDIAFVKLIRKDGEKTTDVGSFIPELYELANVPRGQLKCQIEERAWAKQKWQNRSYPLKTTRTYRHALQLDQPLLYEKLYRKDGQRKTAFELAVIPSHHIIDVERAVKHEFKYRRDKRLPLPVCISKLRVIPDYLQNLNDAGLEIKEYPSHIKVNITNPVIKMSTLEKVVHYSGQWASWLMTCLTALNAGLALYSGAPILIVGAIAGMYLAKRCVNDIAFFDISEAIVRDLGLYRSKELGWQGKFSLKRSLQTITYLTAVAIAMYLAGTSMWAMAMTVPLGWLAPIQTVMASYFAFVGAVSAYITGIFPQRFFWGLSFCDTQIQFTKDMGDALVKHDTKKDLSSALKRSLANAIHKINKYGNKKEKANLIRDIEHAFVPLIKAQRHPGILRSKIPGNHRRFAPGGRKGQ